MITLTAVAMYSMIAVSVATTPRQACGQISVTGTGIAESSSTASDGPLGKHDFRAAKAFDRQGRGGIEDFDASNGDFDYITVFYAEQDRLPVVLKYQFPQPTVVCGYAIVSVPWVEKAMTDSPLSWTFEGSGDGQNWQILHRIEDQTEWGAMEMRRFQLTNPANFALYRLRITHVRGRAQGERFVGVAEIEMYGLVSTEMGQEISQAAASQEGILGDEFMREGRGPNGVLEKFDTPRPAPVQAPEQDATLYNQGPGQGASSYNQGPGQDASSYNQGAPESGTTYGGNTVGHAAEESAPAWGSAASENRSPSTNGWGQQTGSSPSTQGQQGQQAGTQGQQEQQTGSSPSTPEWGQQTGSSSSSSSSGSSSSSSSSDRAVGQDSTHKQNYWDETKEDAAYVGKDVEKAGEDVLKVGEEAAVVDDGHVAEVFLLVGLALFVIGFVVLRHRQSQRESKRKANAAYPVQLPPDGSFSNYLSRPQDNNEYSKVDRASRTSTSFSPIGHHGDL